jgi:apolipoprotein N-acyltransferase
VDLPELKAPLALEISTKEGKVWQVTNGYFCQALANIFNADLVTGLQDDQWVKDDEMRSFSSGIYFFPGGEVGLRYEKQVLLPMAEYIPFDFCKEYAKEYGISSSFCKGLEAKVFPGCKAPFGLCICYEETYGHLMRENRVKGAEVLINLTSDVWYPNSSLPKRHFDHARLRSVEMGIPLLRACNTGITAAINSVGKLLAL